MREAIWQGLGIFRKWKGGHGAGCRLPGAACGNKRNIKLACSPAGSLANFCLPSVPCLKKIKVSPDSPNPEVPALRPGFSKMDRKAKLKEEWVAIAILLAGAVARLTLLSMKPPHFDEGVNGWFVDQMRHTGFYHYDPTNYHGPLHFYVLFLAQTLLGRHIWALRLPLVLVSLGTIWLTTRFDRFIGRDAALWAAAAMAVSPGSVFYARYAIHEGWLVFSLMLCAWGWPGSGRAGRRSTSGRYGRGWRGAILTKETYVIHLICCLLALGWMWVMARVMPPEEREKKAAQQWTWRDMALGAALGAAAIVFFYSGTLMDLPGLKGLYQTYAAWWHTGKTGNGHEKPWPYWLELFGRYEWPSCIGLAVAPVFLFPRTPRVVWITVCAAVGLWLAWSGAQYAAWNHVEAFAPLLSARTPQFAAFVSWPYLLLCGALILGMICASPKLPRVVRALAIYGVGTLAAYSIIHYKTPWCVISLTWPFMLLFGWVVDYGAKKYGAPVSVLASVVIAANLCDMVTLNYYHYTDATEPYVYVQTFNDVNLLMKPLDELVARNPANYQLEGHILMDSYHPLPWLLGDYPNIGYYDGGTNPPKMDADFILCDDSRVDDVENGLHDAYFTNMLTLRDAEDPAKLYLSVKKFQSVFPGRKPDFVPEASAVPAPAGAK